MATPSASRASSIAAVSMMSWLVAPVCTAARAAGSATRLVSTRARPGTGFPVSAAARPSSASSAGPKSAASAALVTAAPAPPGDEPGALERPRERRLRGEHPAQPGCVVGDRRAGA